MGGMLNTVLGAAIQKRYQAEQDNKDKMVAFYHDLLYSPQSSDLIKDNSIREQLTEQYHKLLTPEAKKHAQKGEQTLSQLRQVVGKLLQGQQGGQQPQQPTPAEAKPPQAGGPASQLSAPPPVQASGAQAPSGAPGATPQASTPTGKPPQGGTQLPGLPPYQPPQAAPADVALAQKTAQAQGADLSVPGQLPQHIFKTTEEQQKEAQQKSADELARDEAKTKYTKELDAANEQAKLAAASKIKLAEQVQEDEAMEKYVTSAVSSGTMTSEEGSALRKAHYTKRYTGEAQLPAAKAEEKEDLPNQPGAKLPQDAKDAYGNEIDRRAGAVYRKKDGKFYPEAPPPKADKEPNEYDKKLDLYTKMYREKNGLPADAKLSATQEAQAISQGQQATETPEVKAQRAATLEATNERIQKARETATANASEATKQYAEKYSKGDIKITDIPAKDRDAVVAYMGRAGLDQPETLIPAAQATLAQIDPVLDQIEAAKQALEKIKDKNVPLYYAEDYAKYKLGMDTGASGLIANLSMAGILGASRILKGGASRTKAIFEEAQQHTPSVWKDSPKLIYDKLTQMETSILKGKQALYEEGRRSGVSTSPKGELKTPDSTPKQPSTGPKIKIISVQ